MSARSAPRQGRAPSLTARGRTWAVGSAILLGLGALASSWQVAALGVVSLSTLCVAYLVFYPTSVLIWRRHLELQWVLRRPEGDREFIAGRPFRLAVTLRNRSPRYLGRAQVRVFASSTLDTPPPLLLELGGRREVTVSGEMVARQVGTWHLHGAAVEVTDPLGLCVVEAYFPNMLALQVFPRPSVRGAPILPRPTSGAPHERLGLHALRLRGLGGDLRELREHAPGDPFKQIAWKATARTGRLMVRDLDRETMVTHFLLVDLAATMRQGRPGATKLDFAIDLAGAYARSALEAGDRVGLVTFDGRIVAEVKPNDGPVHRLRLIEPLMDAMSVVDEDLTELTDSELIAAVARYLLYQDGVDTRLRQAPPIDDPAWTHLASSPAGELYDLRVLFRSVHTSLGAAKPDKIKAANLELQRLRLFCQKRGIELPYRRSPQAGRRARGLSQALERAATGRGTQRILVISDLEGLDDGLDGVARSVRLARRRGHHLVCAAPSARLFGGGTSEVSAKPESPADASVAEIVFWDEQRRERSAWRRIGALGVRVVPVGPGDSTHKLVAGMTPGAAAAAPVRAAR